MTAPFPCERCSGGPLLLGGLHELVDRWPGEAWEERHLALLFNHHMGQTGELLCMHPLLQIGERIH
eukprot:3862468-Pleurochrysis_carterae.AAC.1